jgi:hypothetical protein
VGLAGLHRRFSPLPYYLPITSFRLDTRADSQWHLVYLILIDLLTIPLLGKAQPPPVVLALLNLISSDITVSSPNKSLNGVDFIVLRLQTAFGNSSTHFPFFWSSKHFLIDVKMSVFSHSTSPLY